MRNLGFKNWIKAFLQSVFRCVELCCEGARHSDFFDIDLEDKRWSWRLSKMFFEVKSMVVYEFLKWFESGGLPGSASASSPGVEITGF